MKSRRADEQPYERCLQNGPAVLSDAELLAVILRTGTRNADAVDLSRTILKLNRLRPGLTGLSLLTLPELKAVPGIGNVKAIQILCIAELARRIARTDSRQRLRFDRPGTIADYFMEELRTKEQEHLYLLMLDTRCHLIAEKLLTIGTVNQSLVSPREIFIEALRHRAVSIILIHNHPSGDPAPSADDCLVTERVEKAGLMIGIGLADHIIIGDGRYVSFQEEGLLSGP